MYALPFSIISPAIMAIATIAIAYLAHKTFKFNKLTQKTISKLQLANIVPDLLSEKNKKEQAELLVNAALFFRFRKRTL